MEALRRHDLYDEIWQCPTVLVPIEVGGREGEMVVVRPIRSKRAMTASPVELPPVVLDELRQQILGLDGVSSLALDITSKPPGTIEWEQPLSPPLDGPKTGVPLEGTVRPHPAAP